MRVGELIAELQKHDPKTLVLIPCYEFGFVLVRQPEEVSVFPTPQRSANSATHILAQHSDGDASATPALKAICLGVQDPSLVG